MEYIEKGFGYFSWAMRLLTSFIFFLYDVLYFSKISRTPLGVQWLKHHTPMQGAQVQSLVRKLDAMWYS